MRRRILLAILLAVAVTTLALGVPLGLTALRLVETLTREELKTSIQQIALQLDDDLANSRPPDLTDLQSAIPQNRRLIVTLPGHPDQVVGPDPGADVLAEQIEILRKGTVTIQLPAGPTRARQTQVAGLVLLVIVITIAIASGVAIVTARRLAQPLGHVANRAGRLGAGDFRPDPRRYGVAELDRVAEALDTSAGALAELVQRERDLVGDVSHQLRSRLTALQLLSLIHPMRLLRWNRRNGWATSSTSCWPRPAKPARPTRNRLTSPERCQRSPTNGENRCATRAVLFASGWTGGRWPKRRRPGCVRPSACCWTTPYDTARDPSRCLFVPATPPWPSRCPTAAAVSLTNSSRTSSTVACRASARPAWDSRSPVR